MATLLLHTYAPAPRQGILINPSPAASPAYHPASLPALVPSNASLSSSSSSAPGDVSDYFSSSASPSPGPSHSSPAPRKTHLPTSKPRNGSNSGTVRRIRFAPLPEPRRDEEDGSDYPPVFLDDDEAGPSTGDHILAMSSALAAAVNCPLPASVPSSPCASRRILSLPTHDVPGLDPSYSQSSTDSSEPGGQDSQPTTVPSDVGQEWDMVSPSALPALSQSFSAPESPRKSGKLSKMLKPLFSRSSSSTTKSHLARTFSREEAALINGEAQRGRSSSFLSAGSRNSSVSRDASLTRDRRDSDFGAPLHRWTSENGPGVGLPVSKKKRHLLFGGSGSGGGVPLGRTQSLTSLSGKDEKKARAQQPVVVTNGGRKQQRMLNGRVYGARRKPNANPFANVRTDEPEFVEWGYGGMGSVKNTAGQNSMWSRVQAGDDAAGLARKSTDEDDGSGLSWVKRRREQREREKKEQAEREKAEAEAKAKEEGATETAPEGEGEAEAKVAAEEQEQEEDGERTIQEKEHAPVVDPSAVPLPPSAPSSPLVPDATKPEHITQAVTIPAPHSHSHSHSHHRHHHSHSHSHSHPHNHHGHHHTLSVPFVERRESSESARATPASSPPSTVSEECTPVSASAHLLVEIESEERASVNSSGASAMSNTSDDADEEESPKDIEGGFGQDEDEEEYEEDEQLERSRLTALGAGVEKIARHHKEEQGAAGTPAAE
ncbi:hypothetical protein L226DRAFT_546485 [Lentinus tigrinus ALCF2SS1-7]|uniref:Uncharacterized protein n=1 Tax=Lentinus tigrinus ALCF2SS1-6 TaxID=1328759 RepID=A0A5C2S7M7_9APHY|nr:hypothetical protein L227DRAFT_586775 [Lentinus tigrinus ALCF2SS1-6]RPD73552.1 hypothetical protein L226DRAFT_546485 [Lentinus tigrinus ALCF2SS1-7]